MSKVFTFGEYEYTFEREGNSVTPRRSDGAYPFSTYRSYTVQDGQAIPCVHAFSPALPTVRECKQLIVGDLQGMSTSIHRVVWAVTEYDAMRIREQEDSDREGRSIPE